MVESYVQASPFSRFPSSLPLPAIYYQSFLLAITGSLPCFILES